jgi:WD40 repeat protein
VRAVAFHSNNTAVVTGAGGAVAVNTLPLVRAVPASAGPVRALAVTPSGSHVLTGGDDRAVKLWNTGSGANERTFGGGEAAVTALAVSRNGALVAAAGADQAIRLFAFADGKPLMTFKAPGRVRHLAFNPNNQVLAAACADRTLATWNVAYNPGQPLPPEFGRPGQSFAHADAVTDVAFAADNVTLYSASLDRTAKAWKVAGDAPVKNFGHANLVDAVAFNPAGTLLATGSHDGTVRLWDVAKGQQVRQINAHVAPAPPAPVYGVAWSPDGKQLASCSYDRSIKLWDAATGNLVREFKGYKDAAPKEAEKGHRDGVFCIAFSADGKLLVSGSSDRSLKIWNVADGMVVRECVNPNLKATEAGPAAGPPAAHPGWIYSLRLTPDGKHVVTAGNAPRNQGYLAVWALEDGKMLYGEELPLGPIYAVAVSPDGKFLALGCGPRGRQFQDVNSYLLKMPDLGTRRASK